MTIPLMTCFGFSTFGLVGGFGLLATRFSVIVGIARSEQERRWILCYLSRDPSCLLIVGGARWLGLPSLLTGTAARLTQREFRGCKRAKTLVKSSGLIVDHRSSAVASNGASAIAPCVLQARRPWIACERLGRTYPRASFKAWL